MIYGDIDDIKLAGGIFDRLNKVIDGFGPSEDNGRYEIDGDKMYAMVSVYKTKPADTLFFEGHKKYIDVQIVLSGEERLDVAVLPDPRIKEPYSDEKDIMFIDTPKEYLSFILRPGKFLLLKPGDYHRPCCSLKNVEDVRKVVIKIRCDNNAG
ncbi:MAG TPA: YhcH/YjgK/YiaL family protein [Candidatus Omnitrophota bacterium]|nr:YhcH/YjgK/YiaL family protein [Candidatus Omnitrophota bacterium]HPS20972.1 YhcH/YjgK/YiaL family protein [Candidatus Omnitrophota bacterium]